MTKPKTLIGNCHCGAVGFEVSPPDFMVSCNCSLCRRYGALWAHVPPAFAKLTIPEGATHIYSHGGKEIEFHSCKTCGCVTYWRGIDGKNWAVNMKMCAPAQCESIPIRHFDGADSWAFLD